jgi:hypothetical protein
LPRLLVLGLLELVNQDEPSEGGTMKDETSSTKYYLEVGRIEPDYGSIHRNEETGNGYHGSSDTVEVLRFDTVEAAHTVASMAHVTTYAINATDGSQRAFNRGERVFATPDMITYEVRKAAEKDLAGRIKAAKQAALDAPATDPANDVLFPALIDAIDALDYVITSRDDIGENTDDLKKSFGIIQHFAGQHTP